VLVIAVGTYFYITLRNLNGISIPAGNYVVSEYSETAAATTDFTQVEPALISEEPIADLVLDTPQNTPPAPQVDFQQPIAPAQQVAGIAEPAIEQTAAPDLVPPSPDSGAAVIPPVPGPAITDAAPDSNLRVRIDGAGTNPSPQNIVSNAPATDTANTAPETSARTETVATNAAPVTATTAANLEPQVIEPVSTVSFSRRDNSIAISPVVQAAYTAYQQGNLEQAERLYQEVLVTTPLNRNALLGLATIAGRRGDAATALDMYSRMLARDPGDPMAKAGLIEIMPSGSLQEQEATLQSLQRANPNLAPLSYAIGNFMAAQQRWPEAQQAYFAALQSAKSNTLGGAVNPDYAFNLAVSLEHLGQTRPASNYYREALTLASNHPAGFDMAAVRERLLRMESGQ